MGNVEYFDLCEISLNVQCTYCLEGLFTVRAVHCNSQ